MNIQDVKINSTIEFDGKLWYVVEYQKVSRPRLAALFRTKLKNIETGQVLEKNFLPSETVGEVYVEAKEMQFSYEDGDLVYFMDLETYDQVPLDKAQVADVMKYIKDDTYLIALAIEGKMFTSEQLAEKIEQLGIGGKSHVTMVIGGSLGLDDAILKRADLLLSFSKMTFPHQLMRLILVEQLYRSYRIIKGEPYHK